MSFCVNEEGPFSGSRITSTFLVPWQAMKEREERMKKLALAEVMGLFSYGKLTLQGIPCTDTYGVLPYAGRI